MPSRVSDLSSSTKKEVLAQIRSQLGADQYEQLANQIGEDALIEKVMELMQSSPSRPAPRQLGRVGGLLTGLILGLTVGVVFWIAGWLLNMLSSIPPKYSLSALTSGAVITIPFGLVVVWWRKAENEPLDFRAVFRWYWLGSLIGGLLGIARWVFHFEGSLLEIFNSWWISFNQSWVSSAIIIALIVGAILWVLSLGKFPAIHEFVFGFIVMPVFAVWLISLVLGGLADAPLWESSIFSVISQNLGTAAWIVPVAWGGLLGFCWPPRVPANR